MKTIKILFSSIRVTLCLAFISFAVISCSSDEAPIENPEPEVEETLVGSYNGTWNSTTPSVTFTDFPISFEFTNVNPDETSISAVFYAGLNLTSCCGSANDGTASIGLNGNEITSFSLTSTVVDCAGTFTGSGTIDSQGNFIIDFTGSDCDGDHIGQLRVRK